MCVLVCSLVCVLPVCVCVWPPTVHTDLESWVSSVTVSGHRCWCEIWIHTRLNSTRFYSFDTKKDSAAVILSQTDLMWDRRRRSVRAEREPQTASLALACSCSSRQEVDQLTVGFVLFSRDPVLFSLRGFTLDTFEKLNFEFFSLVVSCWINEVWLVFCPWTLESWMFL